MGKKMLKRKYGNRPEWKRIINREYAQTFLDTTEFKGHISLLKINKVTEPLFVDYKERNVCIVDDGYIWLQQFPHGKCHSVTTMFDSNGDIVQWYIDICHKNGVENTIAWMDDLFLDIIVLPSGEVFQKDADELEEALSKGIIDESLYKLARDEANKINNLIKYKKFNLVKLSKTHKEILLKILIDAN